jgi:pimeloyl-ACP methyl ester carboxylesterase
MRKAILLLLSGFFSVGVFAQLHPCTLPGITDPVLCGSYPVFENRQTNTGRIIHLNIVVIPALHRSPVRTPIFFFEGGPGDASTNSATAFADGSTPYRQYHDIVLIDARGTGGSNALHCSSLQFKQGLKEQLEDMYPVGAVKECYDSLSKITDLKQYTTTNIVKDIEDVRKWLGYGKINIWGISYGTRVALAYMKLFPASVESCILWSPLPTYAKMPMYHARFAQNSLQQLFNDCKSDAACHVAFPDIENEFNRLMQKGKKGGLGYSNGVLIPWNAFQTKLRTLLYHPGSMRKIPYIIHETYLGNFKPFLDLYPSGPNTDNSLAEGLYLCITCAEDVPFIPAGAIDSLTKGTFMGAYRIDQQRSACAQWTRGAIPANFHSPTVSAIPTLILSGTFDPVTPTSMAKEIASHLSNSIFVVIPQMSHTFDGLSHPECFDNICLDFINKPVHPNLKLDCIKEMKPGNYITQPASK